jgi:prepilin-type processing-associated H-X9-DG protein
LGKARQSAQAIVCQGNLKQIGLAALLWAEDHDGWAVGGRWFRYGSGEEEIDAKNETSLEPYIASAVATNAADVEEGAGSVLYCPVAKSVTFENMPGMEKVLTYGVNSYMAVNAGLSPGTQGKGPQPWGTDKVYMLKHGVTKLIHLRDAANTVYFLDHEFYRVWSSVFTPNAENPYKTRWHNLKPGELYGYANFAWADGHVSREPQDLADVEEGGREKWQTYFYGE